VELRFPLAAVVDRWILQTHTNPETIEGVPLLERIVHDPAVDE
jgi:hypothetical protein